MIGISGRCVAEQRSSSGLYPFPFDARARRGCTFRPREQNGMPMVQSPGLGDFCHYAMSVFNGFLATTRPLEAAARTAYAVPPDIWTIRAFPRSTRIWAIVFGNVTTSSFFNRYVVSMPANGGRSSSTWTRT